MHPLMKKNINLNLSRSFIFLKKKQEIMLYIIKILIRLIKIQQIRQDKNGIT